MLAMKFQQDSFVVKVKGSLHDSTDIQASAWKKIAQFYANKI